MSSLNRCNIYSLIFGYEDWANEEIVRGRQLFYVNFMFHPLAGPVDALLSQMHKAIEHDFYDKFCWRACRRLRAKGARNYLPKLVAFPDRPVWKRGKRAAPHLSLNGGYHFNGLLSVCSRRRFAEAVDDHIRLGAHVYQGKQLCRVHAEPVTGRIHRLADYSVKSIKRAADLSDYILILPRAAAEVASELSITSDRDRQLKKIQSRLHVSDDTAETLLQKGYGLR